MTSCGKRYRKPRSKKDLRKEAGTPTAIYAGQGGRLYVTCLRTYMLEVYYRHLPIYGEIYRNSVEAKSDAKENPRREELGFWN